MIYGGIMWLNSTQNTEFVQCSSDSITDLLVFDLKVEVSAEPVVEEGLLNVTGGL